MKWLGKSSIPPATGGLSARSLGMTVKRGFGMTVKRGLGILVKRRIGMTM